LSTSERAGGSLQSHTGLPVERSGLDPANLFDLYEHAPCSYILLDRDGRIVQSNGRFRRLVGLSEREALEKNFRQLLTSAGVIFYDTQVLPLLLLNGFRNEIALELVRPPEERIPVLASADLRYSPEGTPSHIRMILLEATQRLQYEHDLLRSRREAEQMAEVVRQSSDAIITMNPDGTVKIWNRGAEEMFGYSASEVMGRSFADLVFPVDRRRDFDRALIALNKGEEVTSETLGLHKDGQLLDLSINLAPHLEAPGILVAFSAIMRNVSSRKLAERALLQSEKLASVGRLASSIAHEINNPLEAVTNLLYLLELRVPTLELKTLVGTAQDELARVSQIATHTLRFYRQTSSRTHLDLRELFDSVLALNRARLRNFGISARIPRVDSVPLLCHEGELRQIVLNIVSNAVDAMKKGGTLTLSSREATSWSSGQKGVRITIADNGTGMDKETLAHIFEPFFSTKGIGGTGLGLWITKDLVDKSGGVIRVRSRRGEIVHGSTIALFFPHDQGSLEAIED
jgi:PAS domain S-box-containing protein